GALLVGSPGTGKTLLAKAVAGEANVPFFSISGSDFVEMFVGVGASRVRDLFQQAAKIAPAIIFIDEIDAIGKSRDSKFGGNDEREQTLNQLLAEIDGFDSSKGVVILAATNRPETLDKALLRAGRFDRRIIVDRPNLSGRYQTLRVHTKNIKLASDVDLHKIATATAGAVGADLANLVNEAALRAVRLGRQTVNQQDLLVSFEVVIAGTEKKGTVLTDMEKRIVAYHEVGHALVAAMEKHAQPVSKITIVPHTSGALGYTMQMPEEEKFLNSKAELTTELKTLLGGRAAEQLVFAVQTTGASNDIERATDLARRMVTQFGMGEKFGLMALSGTSGQYLDGQVYMNCADTTAAEADLEIRDLLAHCYEGSFKILADNRELLDDIALFLLQKETITGDELMAFVNADKNRLPETTESPEEPLELPEVEET
ncbi:MAG: AAA family ATPase, partial [Eubacteriales bacterium]